MPELTQLCTSGIYSLITSKIRFTCAIVFHKRSSHNIKTANYRLLKPMFTLLVCFCAQIAAPVCEQSFSSMITPNPLNAELNPIYHLLELLGAHHILDVSRIRVKQTCVALKGQRRETQCTFLECRATLVTKCTTEVN